jgi:hypothetical protein
MPTGLHSPHRIGMSSESKIKVLKHVVNTYGNNQSLKKMTFLNITLCTQSHKNINLTKNASFAPFTTTGGGRWKFWKN